jgi:hypothetical protein
MPVQTPSPEYTELLPLWSLVRDCVKGEAAIKARGEAYLPKPSGQSAGDYREYMARVHFFDAACRTAEGLHGNIFSKTPAQSGEVTEDFQAFLANVDRAGSGADQFASDLCWDIMQTGWGGILVDHSAVPEGISVAEAEERGLTSFMRRYTAESVINWRYEAVNDGVKLSLVVLREQYEISGEDEFAPAPAARYRVLRLAEGVYSQQVYEKLADKEDYAPVSEPVVPVFQGKPLGFIPFFPCPGLYPEKSMLLGLAYENIGHYQKTADYEQDIHYTGLHTPYVAGMDARIDPQTKKPEPVPIGGSNFIFLPGDEGKVPTVGYLETNGSENILKAIQACEERMAILGARIISVEKKGVETAEAARIHRAGENGVLGAFARNMSGRLSAAIRLAARWRGVDEGVTEGWSYTLNIDYEGDLTSGDEKRLGLLEVEAGLRSKERYLRDFEGMSGEAAAAELEALRAGSAGESPFGSLGEG